MALVFWAEVVLAQQCPIYTKKEELLIQFPHLIPLIEQAEQQFKLELQNPFSSQKTTSDCEPYVIPVVFHIIHNNGPENISDQAVFDQMRRLNIDYNKRNADTANTEPEFKHIIGDVGVEFRLAKLDPQGNPTTGIMRYVSADTYDPNAFDALGRQWPRERYLNVYVKSNIGQGVAGYTLLPAWVDGWPDGDAVHMLYSYVNGDARVLTHEVGHWLNLDHCWGPSNEPGDPGNCGMDDGVFDTPNTIGWTSCNLNGATCGSPKDNVQNYMEYSYCNTMFTLGQTSRMQTTLNSTISDRSNLWQSSNLQATGVGSLTEAHFSASQRIICAGATIELYDESTYGACTWNWTISGPEVVTSTDAFPNITLTEPGSYSVTLVASNDFTSVNKTELGYIIVTDPLEHFLPFSESFDNTSLPNDRWLLEGTNTWALTNSASVSPSYSVWVNNFNDAGGQRQYLTSTGADLSVVESAYINFKVAYAQKISSNNDVLRILMSNDCGETFIFKWGRAGNALKSADPTTNLFVPDTSQWRSFSVPVPNHFLVDGFLFQFEFKGAGGNNIYLDDINLDVVYLDHPILISPENTSLQPISVTLDWKAVDSADDYEYVLDTTLNFNSALLTTGALTFINSDPNNIDTEFLADNLMPNTTYYWKVRIHKNGVDMPWTDVWQFTTDFNVQTKLNSSDIAQYYVYPIPFEDHITFTGPLNGSYDIDIKTIDGKTILKTTLLSTQQIDLPISSGIYVLSVYQNGVLQHVQKMVKF